MESKRIFIFETKTYKESLIKLKDSSVIQIVEKKIKKLIENPHLACPMSKQHFGICEIKVTDKYRVYCIKKERAVILFILGPAINHSKNYQDSKEYKKLFSEMQKISEEFGEDVIKELEKSIS